MRQGRFLRICACPLTPASNLSLGTNAAVKAAPDGYILLPLNIHTVEETLVTNKPSQLKRDFVAVAPISYSGWYWWPIRPCRINQWAS